MDMEMILRASAARIDGQLILEAHEIQTEMIQNELNGKKVEVGLLMVHAQDHLMNAMTVMDLCKEMIDILKINKES